jgi:hypothetical protein
MASKASNGMFNDINVYNSAFGDARSRTVTGSRYDDCARARDNYMYNNRSKRSTQYSKAIFDMSEQLKGQTEN